MTQADRIRNWLGALAAIIGFGIVMTPAPPEPIIIKRVQPNPYQVAESLGCQEVMNACRAHKRQEKIMERMK